MKQRRQKSRRALSGGFFDAKTVTWQNQHGADKLGYRFVSPL